MHPRQPLPRVWMMTDERQGNGLLPAVARLPKGAGIVFRHYSLAPIARRALFEQVRRIARKRRFVLLVGGDGLPRADGRHNRRGGGLGSASAHSLRELRAAERSGARLVFLSPVFATRSHPGVRPLGPRRFAALARQARIPVIALGGMDARKARQLRHAHGWAGIDAWSGG